MIIKKLALITFVLLLSIMMAACAMPSIDSAVSADDNGSVVYHELSSWDDSEYSRDFPRPEADRLTEFTSAGNATAYSIRLDGFPLENAVRYIDSLENAGVETKCYQIYDKVEYPTLNYLGSVNDYSIALSQSENGGVIVITKTEQNDG